MFCRRTAASRLRHFPRHHCSARPLVAELKLSRALSMQIQICAEWNPGISPEDSWLTCDNLKLWQRVVELIITFSSKTSLYGQHWNGKPNHPWRKSFRLRFTTPHDAIVFPNVMGVRFGSKFHLNLHSGVRASCVCGEVRGRPL